jgi:hypothetical protein
MGVFAASGQARTFDYQAGDVGYVPFAMGHYIENTGTTPLRFLNKSGYYADVSLNQGLALTPPELVKAHLKLDTQALAALHKEKYPVVPARSANIDETSAGIAVLQMAFFAEPIYGGKRDMVGCRMIGYPGARYNYLDWVIRHNELSASARQHDGPCGWAPQTR